VKKELERHGFQVNYTDDVEGLPEGATLLLDKKMLIHVRIQKTNDLAERLADNLKKGKSDWSEKEKKKYYVSTLVHENVVFWFTNQERQEDVVNKLEQIIGSLKV
jgi:hypothetical protein